ncbi:MAG: N-acetylneuraminate synthase family protein [Endomicrobium sp.]|jgi:N-acetylneuraminate synthase|nr:N-acetylneuraminate synthase family protein [Endomicrobium sp.]
MAKILLKDSTLIGDYESPYFIAEINSSHNGNLETARQMINKAKEIGCSCVKFQSWSADSLYSKTYYDANPITKRIVQKFSLSDTQLLEMANYCKEVGISFSSTPYSRAEVDFLLNKCNAPYIKVASMDINNYSYLKYIAKCEVPIVLSTGMSEIEEIKKAVYAIEEAGNSQIILLHCISIYPAEPSTINLNNILTLREVFPRYPIGFSDHTIGTEVAVAATALGTAIIEKHFTLDKSKMGMDNNMATEPEEMAQMLKDCCNVYEAMGSKERIVSQAECEQRKKMRRSIVAARDLISGSKVSVDDFDVKRPGTGLPPEKVEQLVGKTLVRDIKADTMILETDFV